MTMVLVEDRTPKVCCGRCGWTKADARRYAREGTGVCEAYGTRYGHHVWIWWEPPSKEED